MDNRKDRDINYDAEGSTPPHEKHDPTDAGYDEAAHRGSEYGVPEGRGGVFGTTGGGTFGEGMHVEERPVVGRDDESQQTGTRGANGSQAAGRGESKAGEPRKS